MSPPNTLSLLRSFITQSESGQLPEIGQPPVEYQVPIFHVSNIKQQVQNLLVIASATYGPAFFGRIGKEMALSGTLSENVIGPRLIFTARVALNTAAGQTAIKTLRQDTDIPQSPIFNGLKNALIGGGMETILSGPLELVELKKLHTPTLRPPMTELYKTMVKRNGSVWLGSELALELTQSYNSQRREQGLPPLTTLQTGGMALLSSFSLGAVSSIWDAQLTTKFLSRPPVIPSPAYFLCRGLMIAPIALARVYTARTAENELEVSVTVEPTVERPKTKVTAQDQDTEKVHPTIEPSI